MLKRLPTWCCARQFASGMCWRLLPWFHTQRELIHFSEAFRPANIEGTFVSVSPVNVDYHRVHGGGGLSPPVSPSFTPLYHWNVPCHQEQHGEDFQVLTTCGLHYTTPLVFICLCEATWQNRPKSACSPSSLHQPKRPTLTW